MFFEFRAYRPVILSLGGWGLKACNLKLEGFALKACDFELRGLLKACNSKFRV